VAGTSTRARTLCIKACWRLTAMAYCCYAKADMSTTASTVPMATLAHANIRRVDS
jgi:hypothetical protein